MPNDPATDRLIGQFQEFMTQQRADMREVKDGLKANTSAINVLALDVATLKTEKATEDKTEEKNKRKWMPFILLPSLGGGGATLAWNAKAISGYFARMLG